MTLFSNLLKRVERLSVTLRKLLFFILVATIVKVEVATIVEIVVKVIKLALIVIEIVTKLASRLRAITISSINFRSIKT